MGLTGCAGAQALGTSELQTLFNSVNAMCGIGLLATPFALAEMGWLALVLMLGDSRAHILGIRDQGSIACMLSPTGGAQECSKGGMAC